MILVPYLIGLCAGIYIGNILANRQHELDAEKELEEVEEKKSKRTRINAYIKKDGDIWYVYNSEDDHFLAQGRTPEEVEKHLAARFPNVGVYLSKENAEEVGYP